MEPLWEFHPGTGWVAGPLLPLPPNGSGFDAAHERYAAPVRGPAETWTGQQCLPATPEVDNAATRPAHPALNGGGLGTLNDAAYTPPPIPHPPSQQIPRQFHNHDFFPLHADSYNLYSVQLPSIHQPSIAQQAGLPIAGLPAEPSAVGAGGRLGTVPHEPEAGPSRHRDLVRATPQLDATGGAGPSLGKRRYCRYETGTATPSSGSLTLVHAPPLPQAPAPPGPSLRLFDPDVPIWPRSAPVGGPNDRLPDVPRRQAASLDPQGTGGAEQRETFYSELPAVDWWRPPTLADHVAVPQYDAASLDLSLPHPAASMGSSAPGSQIQVSERHSSSTADFSNDLIPPFARVSRPSSGSSPQAARQHEASFAHTSADEDDASILALASLRRALQSEERLPIAATSRAGTKSASEPTSRTRSLSTRSTDRSAAFQGDRRILVETGRINSTPQKRVASVEVVASCQSNGCSAVLARLILRAFPNAVVTALENGTKPNEVVTQSQAACVACLGLGGQQGVFRAGDQSHAQSGPSYDATLSAAIDRLEKIGINEPASDLNAEAKGSGSGSPGSDSPEVTEWQHLLLASESPIPERWKKEVLKCDVCGYICGVGVVGCAVVHPGESPYTVEIVCARCDALFQCCSDCGGGGGRLTPGRWRSKELFPDGRKTCRLSHARNPALGEVSMYGKRDVLPVALIPAVELENLERQCRAIYFNTRLAVIARPEYLIDGDGLARSYAEAERVTIDHWNLFSALLHTQPPPESNIRRYLTMMYSTPRKRHRKRSEKQRNESRDAVRKVAWGFVIAQADFNDGTLCWCVTMPWPTNGQAFDAATMMGESTTKRAKADLRAVSQQRVLAQPPLSPLPPLRYTYCLSPFRVGSRGNASLVRRGHEPLAELAKRDPELDLAHFPPKKSIWLPPKYVASMSVFVIRLESEADLGGPPPENVPRKRGRKVAAAADPDNTLPRLPEPALSYFPADLASGCYTHPLDHPQMYPYPGMPQPERPLDVYTLPSSASEAFLYPDQTRR